MMVVSGKLPSGQILDAKSRARYLLCVQFREVLSRWPRKERRSQSLANLVELYVHWSVCRAVGPSVIRLSVRLCAVWCRPGCSVPCPSLCRMEPAWLLRPLSVSAQYGASLAEAWSGWGSGPNSAPNWSHVHVPSWVQRIACIWKPQATKKTP